MFATTAKESLGGAACRKEFIDCGNLLTSGANNLYTSFFQDPASFVDRDKALLSYVANPHAVEMDQNSTLFYIGGNKRCEEGMKLLKQFAPSRMFIFEPVRKFTISLAETFAQYPQVVILDIGLGSEDKTLSVHDLDKGTGAFGDSGVCVESCVELIIKNAADSIREKLDYQGNNFLYLNCEGCEYEVIDQLIDNALISKFRYVHAATHAVNIPRLSLSYCKTRAKLSQTHIMQYGMLFAQERWIRYL